MGSSSGSRFWPKDVSSKDLPDRAASSEARGSYESEVNAYLQCLLRDYNERDTDAINRHLDTILGALSKDDIGALRLLFGGSIKKHTFIDGLSDVDVLITLDKSDLSEKSPKEILSYFADLLRQRLPNTDIKVGNLAVTLTYSDGVEIQVLPALQTKTGIKISSKNGEEWSKVIKPDQFATNLTDVNQKNNGAVVPTIKLFKALNSTLPEETQLSGYHIESIAIEAFKEYEGRKTYKSMLMHLTEYAIEAVNKQIKDKTGQSINVDDYLGDEGSLERRKVNAELYRLYIKLKIADEQTSIEKWKDILGEC